MLRRGQLFLTFLLILLMNGASLPGSTAKPSRAAPDVPLTTLKGELPPAELHPVGQSPAYISEIELGARLLSSNDAGVTFEVSVPWERLRLEPVTADGREYVRVSLQGWPETTQSGAPALPFLAEEIGAPFGVNVSVRVTPGPAHTLKLPSAVVPAVSEKVEWEQPASAADKLLLPSMSSVFVEDAAVYTGQAAYPQALAEVASDGALRQQRVVGIAAYPVQYHPDSIELSIYESLRIEVRFEGIPSVLRPVSSAESTAYETLFRQELLNYKTARQWRQALTPSLSPILGEGSEGVRVEALSPWAPPLPGWRVKIRNDGFYHLTYNELLTAGLPVDTLDPRTFKVYNLGTQVAIEVVGETDGRFDLNDSIVFYGQAIANKYTQDNVYWLTYGQGSGLRMATSDGTPVTGQTPPFYIASRHMEQENQYYLPLAPGDENLDRWMWDYIFPPSRPSWSHNFTLAAPYTGPATLKVAMLGYLQKFINPDHHTQIYLNGTLLDDAWWDGVSWRIANLVLPPDLLVAGNNTLQVVCPNDTGLGYDVVYIDWAELEFANAFIAEGDFLSFRYDEMGTWKYKVDGFSNNQLAVYDVTYPNDVSLIENVSVVSSGSGYAALFQDQVVAPTAYWVTANAAIQTVQAIEMDTPSILRSMTNGVDYIVITHQVFSQPAQTLRNFRASKGLRAMEVDVQDVYDEFGYGIVGPTAIHDFLAYAYTNWLAPAPAYVVLLGDGHYDPKNYQGYGRTSYVPPYLAPVDPWIGETAADNRYVTLVGTDTLPDMMLGRISVNSTAEASAFVKKIIAYEKSSVPGAWQQKLLAVADNADSAGDFAQISDSLLTCCLPAPYQAEKVYYGITHLTTADARGAIQAGINAGKLIVNFIGHGYTKGWAAEDLITTADVDLLQNSGKLPVILAMTCREGYYISPDPLANGQEALGEVVTRAEGKGAVASWSPTGLGVTSGHDYLNRGFLEALFLDGVGTVGKATAAGKLKLWATGSNHDLLDTYILFGDPALRLQIFLHRVMLPIVFQ